MTAAAPAARTDPSTWHWLAAAGLVAVAVVGLDYQLDRPAEPVDVRSDTEPAALRPGTGPATFAEALGHADREVAGTRANLELHPGEWLRMEEAARALFSRYRLTASAADLAEANRLLAEAMDIAPPPAGPNLSRAAVALAAHDLDAAEHALDAFDASRSPALAAEQVEARSMRCEIAYQRGRLAEARRLCAGSDDLGLVLRRANLAARSGDTAEAVRLVDGLLRRPGLSPQTLATLALQRGSVALAEGDWQASGRWVRAADSVFPGYWLSEAYLAQQHALEGGRDEARRRYAALAARTGNADVLDALARLALAGGRAEEARDWARRARAAWEERSRRLPLAYASHYSEHLLLNGERGAALAMAAEDYRRRPHAATITHYAFALWRNGEAERALEVVRTGEEAGFLTADMKLAEAVALGSLGRAGEAGQAMAAARRLNPRIDSPGQQFVAFAQD